MIQPKTLRRKRMCSEINMALRSVFMKMKMKMKMKMMMMMEGHVRILVAVVYWSRGLAVGHIV